ncbi:MAG: DNA-directed RNA polymerase subunit omega [Bacteroidales bacterium]|nr:DNA-directed RNA polymerase subunit omega [Bacteroidales bacterium]
MPVDFKKTTAPLNTLTWDTVALSQKTGNVYEMVNVIAKRANQISVEMKDELGKKLAEFASYNDNLEEVFENREQIEISRFYERLPKPVSIATQEYSQDKLFFRRPEADQQYGHNNDFED